MFGLKIFKDTKTKKIAEKKKQSSNVSKKNAYKKQAGNSITKKNKDTNHAKKTSPVKNYTYKKTNSTKKK